MPSDLFSIFDPNCVWFFDLNWFSMILFLFILPHPYWIIPSRPSIVIYKLYSSISKELICLINLNYKINLLLFVSIFMFILMNNMFSIFPYIFCSTSHMNIGISFSISLWMAMNIYSYFIDLNYSLAHYVPMSTPYLLISFMVMIELISNLIRPLTLAIRLSANLTAGHLILSLIGASFFISKYLFIMVLIIQTLLMLLEMSVSFIQAYVFSVLLTLYMSEIKNE